MLEERHWRSFASSSWNTLFTLQNAVSRGDTEEEHKKMTETDLLTQQEYYTNNMRICTKLANLAMSQLERFSYKTLPRDVQQTKKHSHQQAHVDVVAIRKITFA